MAFKIVEKPAAGRGRASKPEVSVKESGLVSLSKAASEYLAAWVEVYIDADAGKVGLKFIQKETPNAVKVGKNGSFSAKTMLESLLPFDGNYVYPVKKEKEFVVFAKDEGKAIAKRTRKKKEAPAAQSFTA